MSRPLHELLAASHARLAARDARIVADQRAIAALPAPTGDEGRRGRWFADRLRACGVRDVRFDDAGNVIARLNDEARQAPVAICSHLDTVFPAGTPLDQREEGARILGPGINDNARGLAAMLAIAGELVHGDARLARPIELVATVGEEGQGDLRGAKHYFAHEGRYCAAAIALDGPGDDRIVHRALGSRRFRIEFHGPGGHSWAAFGTPNAAHAAACCAATLARVALPAEPRATLSVGRIGGGLSVNAIPEHAWLEVDLRSTDPATLSRLDAELRAAVRAATASENARATLSAGSLAATVEVIGERPCGETAREHPLVQAALEATTLAGCTPDLSLASTDANVPISLGIPAIAIGGGGRGGDAHTLDEWYENAEGPRGIARAFTIIVSAANLSS